MWMQLNPAYLALEVLIKAPVLGKYNDRLTEALILEKISISQKYFYSILKFSSHLTD